MSPAYVDIHKGTQQFAKDNPKILEIVETVYTEAQPTDLTQQVNRVLRKDAQVLQVLNNTASVVLYAVKNGFVSPNKYLFDRTA